MNEIPLAFRMVASDLFTRKLFLNFCLYATAAFFLGKAMYIGESPKIGAFISVLIGALMAFTNASIMARSGRLLEFQVWPITVENIARSTCFAGVLLFFLETLVPQIIFFSSVGSSPFEIFIYFTLALFCYSACWAVLLLPTAYPWSLQFATAAIGIVIRLFFGSIPAISWFFLIFVLGLIFSTQLPNFEGLSAFDSASESPALFSKYYLLYSVVEDRRILINFICVVAFSIFFSFSARDNIVAMSLSFAIVTSASVLTTFVSRDLDTFDYIIMVGARKRFILEYFCVLIVYFFLVCLPSIAVIVATGHWSFGFLIVALIYVVLASVIYVCLDVFYPLRQVHGEKQIAKHPRRLAVPISCVLVNLSIAPMVLY